MGLGAAAARSTRRFGMWLLAASLGAFVPTAAAQVQDRPWLQPGGRECFADWVYVAMSQLNAHAGAADFNARKPFRINEYGVVLDNNDRSNIEPDDWQAFGRDRDARIWGRFRADPDRGWRWPEWNQADVPFLSPFIRDCLERQPASGGATCPPCAAPAPETAELRQACDEYAASAVAQTQEYQRRACRSGQPEWWSTDYGYHQRYCLGRPTNPLPWEGRIMRDRALQQCGAPAMPPAPPAARRWCEVPDRALPGNNRERHANKSVSECKRLCEERGWCRSFDYQKRNRFCQLSAATSRDVALQPQPGNVWDFYTLDCAALGR